MMITKLLLKKVLSFEQQFIKYKTGIVKDINIKNHSYYFFDDMINLKDFNRDLLKIDKKNLKELERI